MNKSIVVLRKYLPPVKYIPVIITFQVKKLCPIWIRKYF